MKNNPGIFVISLDFELFWGVSDGDIDQYIDNLYGVPIAVKHILNAFDKYKIHATWATVGFLFFESKKELVKFMPSKLPEYIDKSLDPYNFIKLNDLDDNKKSIYFAKSLVKKVLRTKNQEIGTHTFSHYYCLHDGQSAKEFKSDIVSALKTAYALDLDIESIVFPRNQVNRDYLKICESLNITSYRGNQSHFLYKNGSTNDSLIKRLIRLSDSYVNISGHNVYRPTVNHNGSLTNIKASAFLRPYSKKLKLLDKLKLRRIKKSMEHAAKTGKVYHIWWHPHNFGINIKENMLLLTNILEYYVFLSKKYNMKTMNMKEVHDHYSNS